MDSFSPAGGDDCSARRMRQQQHFQSTESSAAATVNTFHFRYHCARSPRVRTAGARSHQRHCDPHGDGYQ